MNRPSSDPYRPPVASDTPAPHLVAGPWPLAYILACLLWCGLALVVMRFRPVFLTLFEEFEIALPALTRWLLNPAQNVLFVLIAGGILLAGVFVKHGDGRRRLGRRALLLAGAAIAVFLVGVGLPLLQLLRALS